MSFQPISALPTGHRRRQEYRTSGLQDQFAGVELPGGIMRHAASVAGDDEIGCPRLFYDITAWKRNCAAPLDRLGTPFQGVCELLLDHGEPVADLRLPAINEILLECPLGKVERCGPLAGRNAGHACVEALGEVADDPEACIVRAVNVKMYHQRCIGNSCSCGHHTGAAPDSKRSRNREAGARPHT